MKKTVVLLYMYNKKISTTQIIFFQQRKAFFSTTQIIFFQQRKKKILTSQNSFCFNDANDFFLTTPN